MVGENTFTDKLVNGLISFALCALAVTCLVPFLHVLAQSFSGRGPIAASEIGLWPIGFNLENYRFLTRDDTFLVAAGISVSRVALGVLANVLLCIVTAYPLSLDSLQMPGRTAFKIFLLVGMLFSGGLIPTFLTLSAYGLLNKFAVLILPGILSVFNTILVLNYFRGIPQELREAAIIDGASHLGVLFKVYVPLSMPVLATVALFFAVGHWNSWFDGIVYINLSEKWPLQSYLYTKIIQNKAVGAVDFNTAADYQNVTMQGVQAAMIFVAAVPVMLVYPLLQRYFVKGLTLGSLKG